MHPLPQPGAERRQLTVMFCDMVGSTALAEKLDPEDLRETIAAYRDVCARVIQQFDGHIARYTGDGILVYFGYPQAHEDEGERAVRTSLAIIESLAAIATTRANDAAALAVRVGIATGLVVVGDVIGKGSTEHDAAVGETPNLAARLQGLAQPNQVVIADSTKNLVEGLFEHEDLGSHQLKGISLPVRAWRVVGSTKVESRFEALGALGLTPLVGREEEISLLTRRWQQAKEGEGQVVQVSGEPGIGKSRVIETFGERASGDARTHLHYQCSPYYMSSAFYPFIERMERYAKMDRQDPPEVKLQKLEALLANAVDSVESVAPLIAAMLSIPTGDRYRPLNLTPQRQKDETVAAMAEQFVGLARKQPVMVIFEDVQWIDPTSREVLDLLVDRIQDFPILLVISFRPEFEPQWGAHSHLTTLTLNRLSRRQRAEMIKGVSGGKELPEDVLEQIVERTDGVPLFVEELTKTVLESNLLQEKNGRYFLAGPLHNLAIPSTLTDSLMARLDRLAPYKEVAQIGATVGRQFSYGILAAVSRMAEGRLQDALAELESAGLIIRRGHPPEANYIFKHALVQDVSYETLLKSKRQAIHGRIVTVLEEQFPDIVRNEPELLAHHASEAGLPEVAIQYWINAGQRAAERSANLEAIAHFRRALKALDHFPDTPMRIKQEVEIQLALGIPLIAVRGYPAEETRQAFARAHTLCAKQDNPPEQFRALFGLWGHSWMGGKNDEALRMAQEIQSRSQTSPDTVPFIVAHRVLGSTYLTMGEFQLARQHFEKTIALSDRKGTQPLDDRYMVDPEAAALLLLSWDLWFLGHPDQSHSRVTEGLVLAQKLARPYNIAFAHYMTSVVHLWCGDPARALKSAEESLEISQEQRISLYTILSTISRGCALGQLGDPREALAIIKSGIKEAEDEGVGFMRAMMRSWLADILAQTGQNENALSIVEEEIKSVNDETGRAWESELHRQKAQILLTLEPARVSEAESCVETAIDVARRQGAKSLELRAATDLADLWRTQDRNADARDLLMPIYRWFNEGSDTASLRRAHDVQIALR